jgi:hypothetical protein
MIYSVVQYQLSTFRYLFRRRPPRNLRVAITEPVGRARLDFVPRVGPWAGAGTNVATPSTGTPLSALSPPGNGILGCAASETLLARNGLHQNTLRTSRHGSVTSLNSGSRSRTPPLVRDRGGVGTTSCLNYCESGRSPWLAGDRHPASSDLASTTAMEKSRRYRSR